MTTYSYCPECAAAMAARTQPDGSTRHACSACDFVAYDNPTPVVAAIVQRGESVVLVRNIGWPESWYGLVTGFLERGETPEDGILREVKEELGVEATLESFVGMYSFFQMNQLILAYHVNVPGDAEITLDTQELAHYKLVPITKLKPWPMGTGDAVKAWLAARQHAEHGTQE